MKETVARWWMGITALGSFIGICISIGIASSADDVANMAHVGGDAPPEPFEHLWLRIMTVFSYFTVQSNVLVIVTCGLLAISWKRTSEVFKVFRLIALVAITITGIVYNGYLAHLPGVDPHGWALASTDLLHVFTPFMAVVGWLIFGPRPGFRISRAWWMVAYGVVWVTYTLIRGAILDWYPYPFVNAAKLGYPTVLIICTIIAAIGFGMACLVMWLDQHLPNTPPDKKDAEPEEVSA